MPKKNLKTLNIKIAAKTVSAKNKKTVPGLRDGSYGNNGNSSNSGNSSNGL